MFNPVRRAVSNGFLRLSRNAARKQLLDLSDRTLADIGLSRVALQRGNAAFPWQADDDARSFQPVGMHASSNGTAGRVAHPSPRAITSPSVLSLTLATAVMTPRAENLRKAA